VETHRRYALRPDSLLLETHFITLSCGSLEKRHWLS